MFSNKNLSRQQSRLASLIVQTRLITSPIGFPTHIAYSLHSSTFRVQFIQGWPRSNCSSTSSDVSKFDSHSTGGNHSTSAACLHRGRAWMSADTAALVADFWFWGLRRETQSNTHHHWARHVLFPRDVWVCKIEANHPNNLKRFVVQFDSSWILEVVDGRCLFSRLLYGQKVKGGSVVTRDIDAYEFYLFKKLDWQMHCFSVFEQYEHEKNSYTMATFPFGKMPSFDSMNPSKKTGHHRRWFPSFVPSNLAFWMHYDALQWCTAMMHCMLSHKLHWPCMALPHLLKEKADQSWVRFSRVAAEECYSDPDDLWCLLDTCRMQKLWSIQYLYVTYQ